MNAVAAKIAEADQVLAALRARGDAGAIRIQQALIMNLETRLAEHRELIDALNRQLLK